jgi:hypothetical protein
MEDEDDNLDRRPRVAQFGDVWRLVQEAERQDFERRIPPDVLDELDPVRQHFVTPMSVAHTEGRTVWRCQARLFRKDGQAAEPELDCDPDSINMLTLAAAFR